MSFANPLGLLGLLSLPVIVGIHLYHLRYKPLVVAGMHLWGAEVEVRAAGRRRDRLPITATLLLELLAALLLSLALARPSFGAIGTAEHLIVVLDDSASMMATPSDGENFRHTAIVELKKRAKSLRRGSVVTLILTGRRPTMLAGPAVSWEKAEQELDNWQPSAAQHAFQPAWDLAAQLADKSGRVLFLTDHAPPKNSTVPKQMEVVWVGRPLENVAISAARWSFDSKAVTGRVFLRVGNFGRKTARVTIRGQSKGEAVFRGTAVVEPGQSVPFEKSDLAGGLGEMKITVTSDGDGLSIDDAVTLVEPKVRSLMAAITLTQEDIASRVVRRVLDEIPDLQYGPVDQAHLLIEPAGTLPPSRRDLWWLGIGPLDRSEAARKQAAKTKTNPDDNPFILDKRHPLLEGVVLGGIDWRGAQPIELDVAPIIGDGRHPLLSQLNGTRTTAYLLNIDFAISNLADSPDWPILLANLVELRRDALPGLRRWNYRLDEQIRFRLYENNNSPAAKADADRELVLKHGSKTRPVARTAIVELPPLNEVGVYDIRDGEESIGRFALNFFDADESKLTGLSSGSRKAGAEKPATGFLLDNPYTWLIMLAIVIVLATVFADWFVLRPRRATSKYSS